MTTSALGVGLTYQGGLRTFIERNTSALDYIEVIPDTTWRDRGMGTRPRYSVDPHSAEFLDEIRGQLPLVAHSIGQSIGSADRFDREHLTQVRRWHDRFGFVWHSDHLAFHLVEHGSVNVGFTLPLTRDAATLRLLTGRVRAIQKRVPKPFLLETNVYFFLFPDEELNEAQFLNRLCADSGCGLLLDLHNVYTNARNHGSNAKALLDELDLSHVGEVHLAGGMQHAGFYLDAHCGVTPEPVWELLEHALPRLTALKGITFELFEDWISRVEAARLREELARMREVWQRRPLLAAP